MAERGGKRLRGKSPTPGLAERLRRARREAGLSQEAVAERVNVNRRTVFVWESGKSEPTQERLASLAALYEKPVEWFTEGAGDEVTAKLDGIRDRVAGLPVEYLDVVENFVAALERATTSKP